MALSMEYLHIIQYDKYTGAETRSGSRDTARIDHMHSSAHVFVGKSQGEADVLRKTQFIQSDFQAGRSRTISCVAETQPT